MLIARDGSVTLRCNCLDMGQGIETAPALAPLAPAFANAVAPLKGRRQRELPFRWA